MPKLFWPPHRPAIASTAKVYVWWAVDPVAAQQWLDEFEEIAPDSVRLAAFHDGVWISVLGVRPEQEPSSD